MIELYVHTIYYINGAQQSFDSDKPIEIEKGGFYYVYFGQSGDSTIINADQVNVVKIKHLILTEEAIRKLYKKNYEDVY